VSDQFRVPEKAPKEDEKRKAKQDEKEPEENPPKKSRLQHDGVEESTGEKKGQKMPVAEGIDDVSTPDDVLPHTQGIPLPAFCNNGIEGQTQ